MVKSHCLAAGFAKDLEGLDRESPQKKFAGNLSIFGNMANSDSERKKFGSAEFYEGAIIPTTQSSNSIPGSRGNERQKGKDKAKGIAASRNCKGVNWAETIESNINEENYQPRKQEEKEGISQPGENLSLEVWRAKGSNEMGSELDWGEIDRHGAESEVGNNLMSNDQTYDFGD